MFLALVLAASTVRPNMDWSQFLAKAGIKAEDVQLSRSRWRGGGPFSFPEFEKAWDDWQQVEPTAWNAGSSMVVAAKNPSVCLRTAAALSGLKVLGSVLPSKSAGFEAMLAKCPLDDSQRQAVRNLPRDVSKALGTVLSVWPKFIELRKEAFAGLGLSEADLTAKSSAFGLSYSVDADILKMIDKVDLSKLAEASILLSEAVEQAHFERLRPSSTKLQLETPFGKVIVSGKGDDTHDLAGVALLVDLGGNDTYKGSIANPAQVVVDVSGSDSYENCGFAVAGLNMVFDYGGNDAYTCQDGGNGAASFGVSMVFDREGDDIYRCRDFGEGAAHCGIGLLIDGQGDDSYYCRSQAQGYGGTRGFGALVDAVGNDRYIADDTKIDNPSPQTVEHNVSLAQGAGFGRREDGGNSLAGGIGLLVDGAGDDTYKCGVFGQGVGYWYSFGALVDMAGNDRYEGVYYIQGSSAHYAIGCLIDAGGDDRYLAKMHQSMGQGHDYSIGLLHDAGGIDSFRALGSGAFGTGRWDGLGLFRSDGPASYFTCQSVETLGYAADHRAGEPCNGLFWSTGDVLFDKCPRGKPLTLWVQQEPRKPGEIGVGWSDTSAIVPSSPFTASQMRDVRRIVKLIGKKQEYAKLLVFADPKNPSKAEMARAIVSVFNKYAVYADSIDRRLKQANLDLDAKVADLEALKKELKAIEAEIASHKGIGDSFALVRKLIPAIYRELVLSGTDWEKMVNDLDDWQNRSRKMEKRTAK